MMLRCPLFYSELVSFSLSSLQEKLKQARDDEISALMDLTSNATKYGIELSPRSLKRIRAIKVDVVVVVVVVAVVVFVGGEVGDDGGGGSGGGSVGTEGDGDGSAEGDEGVGAADGGGGDGFNVIGPHLYSVCEN